MKASKVLKGLGVGMICCYCSFLAGCSQKTDSDMKTIGVLQYTEHAALDASYEGFIAALEDEGYVDGDNIHIDFKNAQGQNPTAQTIASQLVNSNVDLVFAIATPAAQAAYNATKDIPIVITAVTDPVESGLTKAWDVSGTNVTGTSDLTPVAKQMELIQELLPEAKTVGILYTTSEVNSEIQVALAEEAAAKLGLDIIKVGITSVNEIPNAIASVVDKVDVIYTPTDNLVSSSMPVVWNACLEKKIPVVTGEEGMAKKGGVATEGIDYFQLGYETGLMAAEVLEGKDPSTMPVKTLENTSLVVNQEHADAIGLNIPDSILERAEIVTSEE